VVNPQIDEALDRVLQAYAETVAAQQPDQETAREISRRVGLSIAHDGPQGSWTTSRSGGETSLGLTAADWSHARHVVESLGGGRYGFSWEVGVPIKAAHDKLVMLLLALIVGVVLLAHEALRYSLRSVRLLYAGVARISDGDLDVEIPRRSRDELGALTDAFNQMARRIKEMIARRDQLLLDVSHELRTPLTRMKVALALVPESPKRARMESDVEEMEITIQGILELERLRDPRGLHVDRHDIVALVREVSRPFAETRPGVRLVLPESPIDVTFDLERVRTLLRNLLDNAAKYSLPDSRPVTITVGLERESVVVRVRDDGPGLAEADLRSVFEPFFRADSSRSKKTGGLGLGLSICKRIVEAHDGDIRAESNPDRGITVVVTLPR
jgi:signal transduction histidine kinase